MPMGLKNASATFQWLMDRVLLGLQNVEMLVYLDIIIYAKNLEDHLRKAMMLFTRLEEAKLVLQPDKVRLLRKEVGFLGHSVSDCVCEPNPELVEAVKNFRQPKTVTHVRAFTALAGYYRRFIKDFSKIAKPLNDLTKKNQKFHWGEKQETSFQTLKRKLCEDPILRFPDFTKQFTLTTDASDYAVGAVLSQEIDGFDLSPTYPGV